ncbi:MAG: hypothetical protein ABI831_07575 [Betaproteobacteria bacterium]
MHKQIAALALSAWMALPAASLHAVEISITARAATQALTDGAFTRGGKYDLITPSKCIHAYLETPQVNFVNDRLVVRFHLSARAAQDIGGQCLGPEDRFWVTVSATPAVANATIVARNFQITELGNPAYRVPLDLALKQGLERALRVDIGQLLRDALGRDPGRYRVTLDGLAITNLRARDNFLRASVDFALTGDAAQ